MNDAELLKFINEIEENYCVEAPKNFKESILLKTNTLPVRAVHETKKLSKNIQLLVYSLKVCVAVLWVLLFLNFSSILSTFTNSVMDYSLNERTGSTITSAITEKTDDMSDKLKTLSDQLLNLGGIFNEFFK